jgi:hypothetical protein
MELITRKYYGSTFSYQKISEVVYFSIQMFSSDPYIVS